jgi:hypothetical protein
MTPLGEAVEFTKAVVRPGAPAELWAGIATGHCGGALELGYVARLAALRHRIGIQ